MTDRGAVGSTTIADSWEDICFTDILNGCLHQVLRRTPWRRFAMKAVVVHDVVDVRIHTPRDCIPSFEIVMIQNVCLTALGYVE